MTSYFIDTNYFLRLLLKDNLNQFKLVKNFFRNAVIEEMDLYTSAVVIFEIAWVLSSFYKKKKSMVIEFLNKILTIEFVHIENREIIINSVSLYGLSNLELEDCYNVSFYKEKSLQEFATFDKKILKFLSK